MGKKSMGFAQFPRELLKWDYYKDVPVKVLYMHCLYKANYKDTTWKGIKIKKGQFITSYKHLVEETGLTRKQVIRAIFVLKREQLIEYQGHNNGRAGYSIITVFAYHYKNEQGTVEDTVNEKPRDIPRDTDNKDIYKDSYKENIKEESEIEESEDEDEDGWFVPYQDENGKWIVAGEES